MHPDAPAAPTRILLVDDTPETLRTLHRLAQGLRGFDLHIRPETSGARARALVRSGAFAVVVADHILGDVDGLAVLAAARAARPDGCRILVTSHEPSELDPARLRAAGVTAILRKPFSMQDALIALHGAAVAQATTSVAPVQHRTHVAPRKVPLVRYFARARKVQS